MKATKKILALALVAVMMMAISVTAFADAQTVAYTGTDGDGATVTINNPAKGETYKIYKLFDATVNGDKIAYQGTVPASLSAYFEADANGNITPKGEIVVTDSEGNVTGTQMTDGLKAALEAWAASASPIGTAESNGAESLQFTNLPYGYYVVTTTNKTGTGANAKSAITVTSTRPNASVFDKNYNEPSVDKQVEKQSYTVGDTVKYTATFNTTNYMGEGENSKQVVEYLIEDTLPPYLANVTVTSVTVGGTPIQPTPQFVNKQITIEWATKNNDNTFTSKYNQGAQIVIQYQATLTSTTNINAADKNTITITPIVDKGNGEKEPWDRSWENSVEIITYAAALKKTDGTNALKGAEFTVAGLTVTETAPGVYTVVSYDPASTTPSTTLKTDDDGKLYIVGLASDVTLTITETKAPDGYNKLTESKELKPQVLSKQLYVLTGYEKYDEDGNLIERSESSSTGFVQVTKNLSELDAAALEIVNVQGDELPSTGGVGTTLFYVFGSLMVLGALVFFITKRRMNAAE